MVHLAVYQMVNKFLFIDHSGSGSSVGIAAGRSAIESRWGRDFPPVQTGPGAHPIFPGRKVRPGRAADVSLPSSAIGLVPFGPHRACNGTTLFFISFLYFVVLRPNAGQGPLILEVSRSHTTTHHSR